MRGLDLSVVVCLSLVVSAVAQDRPALRDYGRLPLVFEPNQGQTGREARFLARTEGATLFLTEREAVLASHGARPVRIRLAHAGKPRAIRGLEPTGGVSNYFIGNDPGQWRTNIPNYGKVEYQSVYPGVDVVYYGNPQKLEYDLVVAAGADASAIQVEYDGVESLRIDQDGDLVLKTAAGELRQKRPAAYQETAAGRVEVKAKYRLMRGRRVGFELARYDAGRRLVIDPALLYSTFLGGTGTDQGYGIAVDSTGATYVTGTTMSSNFPTTNPLQSSNNSVANGNVFVTKINAAGSARVYSTYLGGTGGDTGFGIAVDGTGAAYLTGSTASTNFPTQSPMQSTYGGNTDGFVTKLNPAGSALVYSTYLGGSGADFGEGVAADSSGTVYVTGVTGSTNFPTSNALQSTKGSGASNAFAAKINAAGSAFVYSTYLGGNGGDQGYGIAADSSGNAYLTGFTTSTNFPTQNPIQSYAGDTDAFVTKINSSGSSLTYSTYLGGSGVDQGFAIAVDSSGAAYVTGETTSTNFPTASPLQGSAGGNTDAFVTKINAAGSALVYSTYLGGNGNDQGKGIAVDVVNNVYVTGFTQSTNFPTNNPIQSALGSGGVQNVFVTKFNAVGSSILYSTYLGGSGADWGQGIAVDASDNAYVAGYTTSTNFPTANPMQGSYGGGNFDAFVLSISGNSAVAAFRATSGSIELTSELSTVISNSGGAFASDPSAAQNANGDTFVVARDASNAIWVNVYDHQTRNWDGWTSGGGAVQGVPAIAAVGSTAYIAVRDAFNAYWTDTFTRGSGFGGWLNRGGAFSTDPVIAAAQPTCCTLYVAGKDNFNAIWTVTWLFPAFGTWTLQGAAVQGNPSMTVGSDGAAYIGIRDPSNAVWMGRQNGGTFNAWEPGGGTVATDPKVAASGNKAFAVAITSAGAIWYNTFTEGTGNNWNGWTNAGGTFSSVTAAAGSGPQLFLAGIDNQSQLWWYETPGLGFKFVGATGQSAGLLSAAPK